MQIAYHVMSSPVGLLFLARSERGLRYLEFMDRKSLKRMIANHAEGNPGATWRPSLLELKPIVDQLEGYFHGTRTGFTVPLDPQGSEFQLKVWNALCRIPYGRTRSYGEIASVLGQPRAARAIGLANNQNPIAIIVPCHRVIGSDGSMVGYGGGLQRKQWLLDNEARYAQIEGQNISLFAPPARASGTVAASATPAAAMKPASASIKPKMAPTTTPARNAGTRAPAIKPAPSVRAATANKGGARGGAPKKTIVAAKPARRAAARSTARPATTSRKTPATRHASRGPSR